ncbi:MAG TPA: phosphotransferase, partial [Tepidisphaeraceae bacterium]|nr:phosphotransferase [Tepidisphaeraceae bacterium]
AIVRSGCEWLDNPTFVSALEQLRSVVDQVDTPLIFTNGDYQPGNFLTDGCKITGIIDFEHASFQDPLMGFVKYPIYDLLPLSRTNLIDSVLADTGFSRREFAIRMVAGCLKTLVCGIPYQGGEPSMQAYRHRVLELLTAETSLL